MTQTGTWNIAADVTLTAVYLEAYTVTFVQNGQEAVVKKVQQGGTLTDIPTPVSKTGYTITWDRTDFTNITSNITVNAIETANEYKITYHFGNLADDSNVTIKSEEQKIKYGATFNLYKPECYGYKFVKWVITGTNIEFENGVWAVDKDISLTAVWELDNDSDRWWSDNF